jgi:hypothetical protein
MVRGKPHVNVEKLVVFLLKPLLYGCWKSGYVATAKYIIRTSQDQYLYTKMRKVSGVLFVLDVALSKDTLGKTMQSKANFLIGNAKNV